MNKDEILKKLAELKARREAAADHKLSDEDFATYKKLSAMLKGKGGKGGKDKKDRGHGNDVSFWSKFPQLFKDSANLPMNFVPGTNLIEASDNQNMAVGVAGAIAITMQNTYGEEHDSTGPINMTARRLYLNMHRKYRGLGKYQASDVGIMLIATIELFSMVAEIKRMYQVINRYSVGNRNFPYTLLAACGIRPQLADAIRDDLANFRAEINVLLQKAQCVILPKDIALAQERVQLYGPVYLDAEKGQAVVFRAKTFGYYDPFFAKVAGAVRFPEADVASFWQDCNTPDDIISALRTRVNALTEDDDIQTMYSDLLAADSKGIGFWNVTLLTETDTVQPVYDRTILRKFNNMNTLDGEYPCAEQSLQATSGYIVRQAYISAAYDRFAQDSDFNPLAREKVIYQWDNIIHSSNSYISRWNGTNEGAPAEFTWNGVNHKAIFYSAHSSATPTHSLLNFYGEEATPENIFEACLWKAFTGEIHNTANTAYLMLGLTTGPEVARGFVTFKRVNGVVTNKPGCTVYDAGEALSDMSDIAQFDWHPVVTVVDNAVITPIQQPRILTFIGDVEHARPVIASDVRRIHNTALMSCLATNFGGEQDTAN